jgi:protein-tyrosine phosphatase
MAFNFGPASADEATVFGAARARYPSRNVSQEAVQEWIEYMQAQGIERVCCLLHDIQLAYYPSGLLEAYRAAFGEGNVCHAPVEDFDLAPIELIEKQILPFFVESERLGKKVVAHCSMGRGRTGHILAAWLVYRRGMPMEQALDAVRSVSGVDREPFEALGVHARMQDFEHLFQQVAALRDGDGD